MNASYDPDDFNLDDMLAALQPGDTILHYNIIEALGEGGTAEVYKAEDLKLNRVVAIKILPLSIARNEKARKRLIREARAASALNHPNITMVYSIEDEGDRHFIVMEYVEGKTLALLIRDGALEFFRILEIGVQVADALTAAHAEGLIHRDVKPANIIVTSEGNAKLLDFGLVKRISGFSEKWNDKMWSSSNLSIEGIAPGTVKYMSPEQTRGDSLDSRTDIFSLGCVLYQASTGKLPFDGSNAFDIIVAIRSTDPPPPSSINPNLSASFDSIISRSLRKREADRFHQMSDFADALRKLRAS